MNALIKESIAAMVERLEMIGLIAYKTNDLKTSQEYLRSFDLDCVVKSHSKKGFVKTFYVTYNGNQLDGKPITALSKSMSYQERKNAEMEIIAIAIKQFKNAKTH